MELQPPQSICLFDRFQLTIPPGLKCHQDGLPGKRVLFLFDSEESFNISFEEGMELMDLLPPDDMGVSRQYRKDGKYIHQQHNTNKKGTCAFFHMELEDGKGNVVCLPGQINVSQHYPWAEDIEPMLLELMDGLSLIPDGAPEVRCHG